jgi:translation elongation factor EF-4
MSNHDYPKTRKPTAVVKCPHCSHTGSARGLFTHVRLAHPTIAEKPKTSTKITAHPYDIKGLGHVKKEIHRIEKKTLPKGEYDWLITIAIQLLEKIMIENGLILQSKVKKPYSSAIGQIEKPKRKYYGE